MRAAVTDIEQLSGKMIESCIEIERHLILTFSDGTYAAVQSVAYGDAQLETPELSKLDFDFIHEDSTPYDLFGIGVITKEELEAWHAKRVADRERLDNQQLASERQQYERLKAKFEGGK